jgi:hypothetical protein
MVFEHFLPVFLTVLARASDKVDKTQKGLGHDSASADENGFGS